VFLNSNEIDDFDLVDGFDFIRNFVGDLSVNAHEANGFAALRHTPKRECCDVDFVFAKHAAQFADKAWLIFIANIDHIGREGRIHLNAEETHDAWLAAIDRSDNGEFTL